MATVHHATFALRSRSPTTMPVSGKLLSQNPRAMSFCASFPSLKLRSFRVKQAGKRRHRGGGGGGGGGARMEISPAEVYASALAEVAKSSGTLESTSAEMEKIEKFFSDPSVTSFFVNPVIEIEKKREILDEIISNLKLQPHTANFMNVLVDMRRMGLIKDIVREFETAYNRVTGTEVAIVSSVVPLEPQHLSQIAKGVQKLTMAKNVRIKSVIDPSLVAGLTIRFGNSGSKLIDMSVRKQLEDIAEQLDLGKIKLPALAPAPA